MKVEIKYGVRVFDSILDYTDFLVDFEGSLISINDYKDKIIVTYAKEEITL